MHHVMASMGLVVNILAGVLFPILTFFLLESYTHNVFEKMRPGLILFNFLFYWMSAVLLFGLFGKLRTALMSQTAFFGILGLANYYVMQFRGNPILPWDIYSIKVAASVSDNYDYSLPQDVLHVIFLFLLLLFAEALLCTAVVSKQKILRLILVGVSVAGIGVYTHVLHVDSMVSKLHLYDKLFTPDTMQYKDGSVVAFLMELEYLTVQKPAGYSVEEAQEILASEGGISIADHALTAAHTPNIIVVMNEAFSDPAVLCDLTASEDYMPFVHSLQNGGENAVTGYLDVSVLGGNTANTEFEFLTGNTMAFLTDGSVAYQQYIHQEIPSVVSLLNAYSYETIAMHPYKAAGWNRNTVYPLIGFDRSLFLDDFEDPEYIRSYVSDRSCFEKIKSLYEEKEAGTPMFVFNVTMQNHGSYTKESENFTPDVTVEGVDCFATSQYLSLIKVSDAALSELCDYFAAQEEETIIVMFGDHQPATSVYNPIVKAQGDNINNWTDEEKNRQYLVPFVIWANYDIEEASDVSMSVNYLPQYLLKIAGLEGDGYMNYLDTLYEQFPVISGRRIQTSDGSSYEKSDALSLFEEDLSIYQALQYYRIFDFQVGDIQ
ncbi:MAG: LTA synthase family protein [Lachnospiraceae bacterium]|nr:LTA synthase family protein [Lachnospiraceae bacterium]